MNLQTTTLKDGLILRSAAKEDIPRIADFNQRLHPDPGESEIIGKMLHAWTTDLGNGKHPTTDAHHFTLIEDPAANNKLVSTMCVIPQAWVYGGLPYKVARIELVGTDEVYRKRGLVREQFNWHHQWCQENGYLVQAITGIPYYYRQFGYEMCVNLNGSRYGLEQTLPLKHEGEEAYNFRPATNEDIPFLMQVEEQVILRSANACQRSKAEWHYEIAERSEMSIYYRHIEIIADKEGHPKGFLVYPDDLWGKEKAINRLEVIEGYSWLDVIQAVIRHMWLVGQENAAKDEKASCTGIRFNFGTSHPSYPLIEQWLPFSAPPYSWYMRVGNLPAFLRHITPVLEKRLAISPITGYSGEVILNFYKNGLKMIFNNGKIKSIENWQPGIHENGHVRVPGTTFNHLLFGHRDIDEIHYLYAEAGVNKSMKALLATLFPKQPTEEIWAFA